MLPATQLQKDAPPVRLQTTCDATPLVVSRDVISRQSFVAYPPVGRCERVWRLPVNSSHGQLVTTPSDTTVNWSHDFTV